MDLAHVFNGLGYAGCTDTVNPTPPRSASHD